MRPYGHGSRGPSPCAPARVRYAILFMLMTATLGNAKRGTTFASKEAAREFDVNFKQTATAPTANATATLYSKTTSVDHFGSVRFCVFIIKAT